MLRQGGRVTCWERGLERTPREIDIPEAVHVSVGYEDACAALARGEIACRTGPEPDDIGVLRWTMRIEGPR
ncbi:uncharacterized protein SOCEGT47_043020 [Sorangium cellulosum]|uniref:Uncharacterized protein n=1 Tax=Sorangium cellulosum TaxID=56 RepID=A0A4V0NDT3_SORCE|nr:uncharacterized protein SOCEGT47_043020 [Sorangium cellulosum]